MRQRAWLKKAGALTFLFLFSLIANGATLDIVDDIQTYTSLTDTTVNMSGQSELHITDGTSPIPGCQINLNSSDSWFFLEQIEPSVVSSAYLSQIQVSGAPAVLNSNVRIAPYLSGAVVIPHTPSYQPLQIYSDYYCNGSSMSLGLYTYYKSGSLGTLNDAVSSFKLKRGYMATFAQDDNGTGISKVYVAQDEDINIDVMPEELNNSVSFIRVFPWRWTGKKGWAGGGSYPGLVDSQWYYDWDNVATSSLDTEYIPMRHNLNWNAYSNIDSKQNSTAVLAFNEPDKTDQANMTVAQAIEHWPNFLASGLRIGSPAPSDGGLSWLYDFIDEADALNYRVDFVAVHCYQGCYTASQWYNWLKAVHERTGRPLWVTEWNNGCNWTGCEPATQAEQAAKIAEFIEVMDNAPFVERYAVYNGCSSRELIIDSVLTLAGEVYRDNETPMAYIQPPAEGDGGCAYYEFENDTQDSLIFGNHAVAAGSPAYTTGHSGQAIDLDGSSDYIMVPANLGDSTDFTFAAWVYWDGSSQWQRIFDFGNGTTYYMFLTPRSGGNTLRFAISTTSYSNEQRLETSQLATGQWVHLAVTISGDTGKLFVNGSPVDTNTGMTLNPSDLNTISNYLGKAQFKADPLFNGRLDDVRIADYALTDTEIAALAGGSAGNFAPVFTNDPVTKPSVLYGNTFNDSLIYNAGDIDADALLTFSKVDGPSWLTVAADGTLSGTPSICDLGVNSFTVRVTDPVGADGETTLNIRVYGYGLRAHYKLNSNTNDVVDSNNGTVTGSAAYTTGMVGDAIDLDAVDDYITLPPGVADSDDITIAAWVYWDTAGQWQRIFDFGNGTNQYMFLSPQSGSNTLRFAIKNGGSEQRVEAAQLATGQWVHLAVKLRTNNGKIYVNGVEEGSTIDTMTIDPGDFKPNINYIGRSQFGLDPLFDGRIDDFRIYNHGLNLAQVETLAAGAANNPPEFTTDPINLNATEGANYYGQSLAAYAYDLEGYDRITFSKISGPDWLVVADNGALSGMPGELDIGENSFTVQVLDHLGLLDIADLIINVADGYSGVNGMDDLRGFAAYWLSFGCIDVPACGGADLNSDGDVDILDLAVFASNWQPEL